MSSSQKKTAHLLPIERPELAFIHIQDSLRLIHQVLGVTLAAEQITTPYYSTWQRQALRNQVAIQFVNNSYRPTQHEISIAELDIVLGHIKSTFLEEAVILKNAVNRAFIYYVVGMHRSALIVNDAIERAQQTPHR